MERWIFRQRLFWICYFAGRKFKKYQKRILDLRSIKNTTMEPYKRILCNLSSIDGKTGVRMVKTESGAGTKDIVERRTKFKASDPTVSISIGQKQKQSPPRPNYFVAVPIMNAQIREKLQDVQKTIVGFDKKLQSVMVSLAKTHITLMVMHLKDQAEIDCATNALAKVLTTMKADGINEMKLNFDGLGHFRNQVVFAKIFEDNELVKLRRIAEIVRTTFAEFGLPSTDDRPFQEHMTVAKLSKDPKLRYRGIKKIDGRYYKEFLSMKFGEENCSKLQLLSMMATDKATGYYACVSEGEFCDKIAIVPNEIL